MGLTDPALSKTNQELVKIRAGINIYDDIFVKDWTGLFANVPLVIDSGSASILYKMEEAFFGYWPMAITETFRIELYDKSNVKVYDNTCPPSSGGNSYIIIAQDGNVTEVSAMPFANICKNVFFRKAILTKVGATPAFGSASIMQKYFRLT